MTKPINDELIKCPYCDGAAEGREIVPHDGSPEVGAVKCRGCGAQIIRPTLAEAIDAWNRRLITGETSDGYHTFNELYHHRAILFSVICARFRDRAWKSKLHDDGTMYDGMFIVGIDTPGGQATYHYDIDPYWSQFDVREFDKAPKWDGHSSDDAIQRLGSLRRALTGLECWRREIEL